MKLKKTMKIKKPVVTQADGASSGGPAINSRLRLDPVAPQKDLPTSGGLSATFAFAFGLIALLTSGLLAYMLYLHWEYLMPA